MLIFILFVFIRAFILSMILSLAGNIFPNNIILEYMPDHFLGIEVKSALPEYFECIDENVLDKADS